jgi:6-phosphogluconolactonase
MKMYKLFAVLWMFCLFGFSGAVFSQSKPAKELLYIGTYSQRGSQGIYVFEFDRKNNRIALIQTVQEKESPSFLSIHPNKKRLYAVYREGLTSDSKNGTVACFKIGEKGKLTKLNEQSSEGRGPCHVSVDPRGDFVYVSNYVDGSLAVFPVGENGQLSPASDVIVHKGSGPNERRQRSAHMHSMVPSSKGKYVYASDLGMDAIIAYALNRDKGTLSYAEDQYTQAKAGGGPRHFDIHPSGKYAYSVEELTSTIAAYAVDENNGALRLLERERMLPDNFTAKNTAADIQVSPDGKFLYASNRGHNSLAVFAIDPERGKLDFIEHTGTQGKRPRNLLVDQKGSFVFVANRDSDNVVVFERNQNTGTLEYSGEKVTVPAAVCIQQLILR